MPKNDGQPHMGGVGYDMAPEALALAQAIAAFKAATGRGFPSWSEAWTYMRPRLLALGWLPPTIKPPAPEAP